MKSPFVAAIVVSLLVLCESSAQAQHKSVVYFTHPTAATGPSYIFANNDPNFKVLTGGKCGQPYLSGSFMGMADPSIKDPTQVCGWGKVYQVPDSDKVGKPGNPQTGKPGETGTAPLSILPIEAPMPVEEGAQADAARIIRDMLPRLDKSDGDKMPVIIQIRERILTMDVNNTLKYLPKRHTR